MKEKRKCSVEGCNKPHKLKGYCNNHFIIYKHKGLIEGCLTCSVIGCSHIIYAKGLCHNHYELKRTTGRIEYKYVMIKCKAHGCNEYGKFRIGFCASHLLRFRRKIPFDAEPYETMRGKGNPRWAGGISEYPNHSLMKKIRLEVLKEANYICQECGGRADRIHHKDHSKKIIQKKILRQSVQNVMRSSVPQNSEGYMEKPVRK